MNLTSPLASITWQEAQGWAASAVIIIAAGILIWYGVLSKLFTGWKDLADQRKEKIVELEKENKELRGELAEIRMQAQISIREADMRRAINDQDTLNIRALRDECQIYKNALLALEGEAKIHITKG